MKSLYFVSNDKDEFLWHDEKFYPAFTKTPYAVDEGLAKCYAQKGFKIERVDFKKFAPELFLNIPEERKRRTYVRCSGFALANALDRLHEDNGVRNLCLSMEDGDFLISFDYLRDHERLSPKSESCSPGESHE